MSILRRNETEILTGTEDRLEASVHCNVHPHDGIPSVDEFYVS